MKTETKQIEAQYLRKGDILTFTKGVVTHVPYTDLRTPSGKINLGINGFLKTWNKKTIIVVNA